MRGFVNALRVQSKIIFLVVRDIEGEIQTVIVKDNPNFETAKNLSLESVVEVTGLAKKSKQAQMGVEIEVKMLTA
mgnify:FL=1